MSADDPRQTIEYKGNSTKPGNPLWDEWVDKRTGKSSLEIHTPKNIHICKENDHDYQVLDSNGNVQCANCPMGKRIVWGIEKIEDGKIVKLASKNEQISS